MKLTNIVHCFLMMLCILMADETFGQHLNLPREKVHMHLDKSSYSAGDTLWFKAYTVTAGSNEPSVISKILHVELFGPDGKIVSRLKLPMRSGRSPGDITLDDTLRNGRYHLRAYTNYMRNYGETAFFERDFELTGGFLAKPENYRHQTNTAVIPEVQFFAEGGDLVAGLRNRVGVKITGPDGLGLPATGAIIDERNTIVSNFTDAYAGISSFSFIPQTGIKYTALIKLQDGTSLKRVLPEAKEQGYVLSVNNLEPDTIFMSISQNALLTPSELIITVSNETDEYYLARVLPRHNRAAVAISRKQLPVGTVRVTLYTINNKPLAERLLFKRPYRSFKLKGSPQQ